MFKLKFPEGKIKAFTLSYDDGSVHDARLIEIFDKHGLKCTFNVPAKRFLDNPAEAARSTELYKKAIANGHEVATHGLTHPFLTRLSDDQVAYEIIKDRELLENALGVIVRGHAYPFGNFNDRVVDILKKCGIVYARTCVANPSFGITSDWLRMHVTCHHDDEKLFELADKFLHEENPHPYTTPWLFYVWGHSHEFAIKNNWERIEEFSALMEGHNDVWYATNIEIYDYITCLRSLVYSLDHKHVYNPSHQTVWFEKSGKEYKVEAGQTITLD